MSDFKLVTIYRSMGMLGAQVIKGKLESAGIPVMLKYESAGLIFGLTVDGLGMVEVQVPEEWAEDAEALISEEPEDADSQVSADDAGAGGPDEAEPA
jgi:hypothetical protein